MKKKSNNQQQDIYFSIQPLMALKLCDGTKVSHYPSAGSFHEGVFLLDHKR